VDIGVVICTQGSFAEILSGKQRNSIVLHWEVAAGIATAVVVAAASLTAFAHAASSTGGGVSSSMCGTPALRAAATMAARLDLNSSTGTDRRPLQACNITHNSHVTAHVTVM
jgi:hypothetical protein